MLLDACGFPIIESNDHLSPVALRELADAADARFQAQETEIDWLERPELMLAKLSGIQPVTTSVNNTPVAFDTVSYTSRSGAQVTGAGINVRAPWRSGIYHVGMWVDGLTSGTINEIFLDLIIEDRRGLRLQNQFTEYVRVATGPSNRGAVAIAATQLFEVHAVNDAIFSVYAGVSGSGTFTVQATSTLWLYRVRGLSDV